MTFRSYFSSLLLICAALLPAPQVTMATMSMEEREEDGNEEASTPQTKGALPILLYADNIDYDQETDTVIATGNVQITQGQRLLRAQKITYNRKTGKMTAAGNVCLKEKERVSLSPNPETSQNREFLSHQDLIIHSLKQSSALMSNPLNLPELGKQLPMPTEDEERGEHTPDYNLSFAPYAEFSNKSQA